MSVTSPTGTPATRTFDFLSRPATESKTAVTLCVGPPPSDTRSILRTKYPRTARMINMKMPTLAADDISALRSFFDCKAGQYRPYAAFEKAKQVVIQRHS